MPRQKSKATKCASAITTNVEKFVELFGGTYEPSVFVGEVVKQLPGAIIFYSSPTTKEIKYEALGWMDHPEIHKRIHEWAGDLYAVRRLSAVPAGVRLTKAQSAQPPLSVPKPNPLSKHLREKLRLAWTMVTQKAMAAVGGAKKLCNAGKKPETGSGSVVSVWLPSEDSCGCGGSCVEARIALGWPAVPLVDPQIISLANPAMEAGIEWACGRSPEYAEAAARLDAEWAEEKRRYQAAKEAAKASSADADADLFALDPEVDGEEDAELAGPSAGGALVSPDLLASVFASYNLAGKKNNEQRLRAELAEKGVRLSSERLASALKAAGLAWGKPTAAQVVSLKDKFEGYSGEGSRSEALKRAAGEIGLKPTTARRHLTAAGVEFTKRGRPAKAERGRGRKRQRSAQRAAPGDNDSEAAETDADEELAQDDEDDGESASEVEGGASDDADDVDEDAPCAICGETEAGTKGTMIFCDDCDACYHVSCHRPPLRRTPPGRWHCSECKPTRARSRQRPSAGTAGGPGGSGEHGLHRETSAAAGGLLPPQPAPAHAVSPTAAQQTATLAAARAGGGRGTRRLSTRAAPTAALSVSPTALPPQAMGPAAGAGAGPGPGLLPPHAAPASAADGGQQQNATRVAGGAGSESSRGPPPLPPPPPSAPAHLSPSLVVSSTALPLQAMGAAAGAEGGPGPGLLLPHAAPASAADGGQQQNATRVAGGAGSESSRGPPPLPPPPPSAPAHLSPSLVVSPTALPPQAMGAAAGAGGGPGPGLLPPHAAPTQQSHPAGSSSGG